MLTQDVLQQALLESTSTWDPDLSRLILLIVSGYNPSWWGRHGRRSEAAGHTASQSGSREADAGAQAVLNFIQPGNPAYRMMLPASGRLLPLS